MDQFEKGPLIGVGVHGRVYRAVHKASQQIVALKKISMGDNVSGIPRAALREIAVLREMQAPYMIRFIDAFPHKQALILVLEYMETDLEAIIKDCEANLTPADVKVYIQTLLQALSMLHSAGIMHRDIKPNNVLLDGNGQAKLADFGLARFIRSPSSSRMTKEIGGRSYRAPELLFGALQYSNAVDMWGAGCVMAELLLRKPWFPGTSDMNQLERIFNALGAPTEESWPEAKELPNFIPWNDVHPTPLSSQFPPSTDPLALDLLSQLMHLSPARRISAAQALQHPYFTSPPLPAGDLERYKPPPRRLQQAPQVMKHVLSFADLERRSLFSMMMEGEDSLQETSASADGSVRSGHLMLGHLSGSYQDIFSSLVASSEDGSAPNSNDAGCMNSDGVPRFRLGTIPRRFSQNSLPSIPAAAPGSTTGAMGAVRCSNGEEHAGTLFGCRLGAVLGGSAAASAAKSPSAVRHIPLPRAVSRSPTSHLRQPLISPPLTLRTDLSSLSVPTATLSASASAPSSGSEAPDYSVKSSSSAGDSASHMKDQNMPPFASVTDQSAVPGLSCRFRVKSSIDPVVESDRSEGEDPTGCSRRGLPRVPLFHLAPTPETNTSLPFTFAPSLASAHTASAHCAKDDLMTLQEAPTPLLPVGPGHDVTSLTCNEHMSSAMMPYTSSHGQLKRRRLFESMDRPVHGTRWVPGSVMTLSDDKGREGTPEEDGVVAAALHERLMHESMRRETPEGSAVRDGVAGVEIDSRAKISQDSLSLDSWSRSLSAL
ncbi:hypothetical protein CEUSTIGMA_g6152.t1 [Chlamydomonas eustigma]|uniref:[RNA-polymerase]-subunit kinase n=1 Tax=Chlamydomonas eustigma TaxID=1157962 RepID=A0A250X6J8_9CHLO|nr:hypothetical protein CEUSTIGMA_g6152.t1 [Chlamydomonas eustigma]|eukprot:GAX78714.1 hypothetical protein CEUSTIGMA_g6152.t1 [Chlamydomonas eustigma]